jgi:thiol-disulfide isomerase/thioredoxin
MRRLLLLLLAFLASFGASVRPGLLRRVSVSTGRRSLSQAGLPRAAARAAAAVPSSTSLLCSATGQGDDAGRDDAVTTAAPPSGETAPSFVLPESTRNKYVAAISAILGSAIFVFQHGQPVNSVALLKAMERDSMDVNVALCNGRPTMVEFYADWCESCKVMAPAMRSLEAQYKDRINFITIDGGSARNADMVKRFGVDGIPHVAFLTPQNEVQTALVGAVPKKILVEEATALVQGQPLPYEGYDAFEERSHFPMEDVTKACRL